MFIMHLKHFFAMGGYAFYVWPAYLIGLTVLVGNAFWTRFTKRQLWKKLINKRRRWEQQKNAS